ncbi:hypothetical protein [Psychroflexus planctonicus]|uniref:DKNYY family protein n=1 Tax=Psychroflexus planctonicus TaxID=1526575 RepID=A0ABQ1SFR0_9FLAO|nr:hypothetical protein [Psychroflexus planctonicus]GGE28999.1 hypothetical protein GCM10010832_07010 [Psychroflexus planctonicus]
MNKFEIPTDLQPFVLDENCIFFSDHYIIDGVEVFYKDITHIISSNARQAMNGFEINSESTYFVNASKSDIILMDDELIYAFNDFSFKTGLIKTHRKFIKKQKFIHNFLFEKTKKYRLEKSIKTLKQIGYIEIYEGAKIYDNGDMIVNGKLEGNFNEKFKTGKLITGVKYGGYSNNVSDPYEFGFIKGTKFFGIIEDKFVYKNVINTDIFDILFTNLFRNNGLSIF